MNLGSRVEQVDCPLQSPCATQLLKLIFTRAPRHVLRGAAVYNDDVNLPMFSAAVAEMCNQAWLHDPSKQTIPGWRSYTATIEKVVNFADGAMQHGEV